LPWVMLGIRATPKEDSGVTAARMVYGAELVWPGQPTAAAAATADSGPRGNGGGKDEQGSGPSIHLRARSYAEAAKGPVGELEGQILCIFAAAAGAAQCSRRMKGRSEYWSAETRLLSFKSAPGLR
jgi:hypothetical protein